MTTALVEMGHGGVPRRGQGVRVELAGRHDGAAAPARWLRVAGVRAQENEFDVEMLEVAAAARAGARGGGGASRVELAARWFAGQPVEVAGEAATGRSAAAAAWRGAARTWGGRGHIVVRAEHHRPAAVAPLAGSFWPGPKVARPRMAGFGAP